MKKKNAWLMGMGSALILVAAAGGWWISRSMSPAHGTGDDTAPCPKGAAPLYWRAPMDPSFVRNEPGKSPMGMDLVPVCPEESPVGEGGGIRIDPALVQSMGVRTAPVERRDLARSIRTVGHVAYDEGRVSHVHTKVQGWIEELYVEYEGATVDRGQPMLEIYSPELVSTQEELLQATQYRDDTSSSPFEDIVEGGQALYRASRRRLELWDIPDRDIQRLLETRRIQKNLTLYAPGPGVVVDLGARKGMEVDANTRLYTIADLSHVWVYADIYEYELPWIEAGQRAIVELSYLPGKEFESEVTYVYPVLDPETRTARVRLELLNPGLILKPDMLANVTLQAQPRADVLSIPDAAVLRSGRRSLVFVATGGGHFEPRPVELGVDTGEGWIEIREGLREGERVVTSGQFLIDSESRLRETVQKMLAPTQAKE
jgi:Cu(I)/Ag(I) efflux system membrane fusion protein/cobalt-zinc-cadmium efflux system membrane fusion protein